MQSIALHQGRVERHGHTTSYLEMNPLHRDEVTGNSAEGLPTIVFVHGWPERGYSWRHQLPVAAGLGFRALAPDLRGYGESTVYTETSAYSLEKMVGDMIGMLDALEISEAIWVGHDWGGPIVWSIASHHPERCRGVASLCVPYFHLERGLDYVIKRVDRSIYPESQFPAGQWDYQRYYEESFEAATAAFDANPRATIKALFRKGDPAGIGQITGTSEVRRLGGWFGGLPEAPDIPIDTDVISETDLDFYVEGLTKNGFFGPDSFYVNHSVNAEYATRAVNGGQLAMPALFLAGRYDFVCETVTSRAAEPMRSVCLDLEEHIIDSGHWMAQERPVEVNQALASWLLRRYLTQVP